MKTMRPPTPVPIAGGGVINNTTTIANETSSVAVIADASGNPNVQITTDQVLAINIDNNQNVQIGATAAETATSASSRLVVSAPYGQCIQLINESVNQSAFLEANAQGGLTISSTGGGLNLASNKVYLGPNSLYINNALVSSTAEQLNYIQSTPGYATAMKALVVDASRNIININSLAASSLTGTLLTAAQPNITSLNNVNISTLKLNSTTVLSTAAELNYLNSISLGTAKASHALVVDVNRNITNINDLAASSLSGTLLTPAQPNITSIGALSSLNVNGNIGIGTSTPSRSLDITSSSPAIRLTRNEFSLELLLNADGSTRFSTSKDIFFDSNRNLHLSGSGSILGANAVIASALTGTLQTPIQSNVTSLGALSSLSVNGDVTIGLDTAASNTHRVIINESNGNLIRLVRSNYKCDLTINNAGDFMVSPIGDLILSSGTSLFMNGHIEGVTSLSAVSLSGTLLTPAQPNITTIGTLNSLSVNNGIVASSLSASTLTGTLLTAEQPNIKLIGTLPSLTVTNNITANAVSSSTLAGTLVTPIQTNITSIGTLGNLTVTNTISTSKVESSTLTGTLLTAAQPNITLIGDLNSLSVHNTLSAGAIESASIKGTLITSSQPNITTIGTLNSLLVNNGIEANSLIASTLTGTLLTSAQPNINVIGTLSSLNVTNGITTESLSASTLTGTLLTPTQRNITEIGTLTSLTVMAPIGIGMPVPLCAVDINTYNTSIVPEIRIDNGTVGAYIGVDTNGLYIDTSSGGIMLGPDVGIQFAAGGALTGLTSLSVTSLTGTLTTGPQPHITELGMLNYLDTQSIGIGVVHDSEYKLSIFNPSGSMIKYDNGSVSMKMGVCPCGTYTFTPSNLEVALDTNVNLVFRGGTIIGLDTLTAPNLYGQIQDSYQPKITQLGPLTNLTVNGPASVVDLTATGSAHVLGDLTVDGSLILTTPLQSSSNMSSANGRFDSNIAATSSTNGGTLTVIGGGSFSKNVIIGDTLTIGTATISDTDIVPLQGYTAGTVIANRILVPDSNKDLSGFRNLASTNFIGLIQTACQPAITQVGDLLTLNVGGYLGVGTSTPSTQLEVNSTTGNCLRLSYDKLRYTSNMNLSVDEFGNGRIATSGPSLTVSSTLKATKIMLGNSVNTDIPMEIGYTPFIIQSSYAYNTASNSHGVMNPNGLAYNYSIRALGRILCTQSLDVMSDRRTKTNINELTDEYCSSFVEATTPVSFNWINGEAHKSYGYIAQDLIRAGFPELVNLVEDSDVEEVIDDDGFISPAGVKFTVTYEHVIPILAKNQKRLMQENAELRAKLDAILDMLNNK